MKQKISAPVAIAIVVVVVLVLFSLLYRQYLYQPTYSVEDIAEKYKRAAAKMQAPPNVPSQPPNGKP
ncbi:MAG TPA: hypothetical protein VFB21_21275 [Chthonomonadaceae bacterium]|nr:hypothetical protein [Chthonomonadaceae bacterium]